MRFSPEGGEPLRRGALPTFADLTHHPGPARVLEAAAAVLLLINLHERAP